MRERVAASEAMNMYSVDLDLATHHSDSDLLKGWRNSGSKNLRDLHC